MGVGRAARGIELTDWLIDISVSSCWTLGSAGWPITHKAPRRKVLAKKSMSAEGRRNAGSLPPSSMQVGTMMSAAAAAT